MGRTCLITLALLVAGFATKVSADPWTTFPGTKARGMGTAFVAIANDPSAVWYNPAGLYQMKGYNISVEGGNAPKYELDDGRAFLFFDLDNPEATENIEIFFGSAWTEVQSGNDSYFISLNKGDGKTYGLSLYYYEPYSIETTQLRGVVQHLRGFIEEDVSIVGLGYSGKIYAREESDNKWFSSLHYGVTLEYVEVDIGNSILEFDLDGVETNLKPIPVDDIDVEEGLSGSVGFLATVYNGHLGDDFSPTVKFGGVYRSDSFSKADSKEFTFTDDMGTFSLAAENYFNAKPASWDVGLSSNMKIYSSVGVGLVSLETAVQYGETEFDSVLTDMTYDKMAYGLALRLTRSKDAFIRQIEFRLGSYKETSDSFKNEILSHNNAIRRDTRGPHSPQDGLIYPDVSGFTWGVQLAFDNGFLLEFANEERDLDNALFCEVTDLLINVCDNDLTQQKISARYWTVALRYSW